MTCLVIACVHYFSVLKLDILYGLFIIFWITCEILFLLYSITCLSVSLWNNLWL